jgi:hypothetical protein
VPSPSWRSGKKKHDDGLEFRCEPPAAMQTQVAHTYNILYALSSEDLHNFTLSMNCGAAELRIFGAPHYRRQ